MKFRREQMVQETKQQNAKPFLPTEVELLTREGYLEKLAGGRDDVDFEKIAALFDGKLTGVRAESGKGLFCLAGEPQKLRIAYLRTSTELESNPSKYTSAK